MRMTGTQRVLTALRRGCPDAVPTLELAHNRNVVEAILPGGSYEDFLDHLDLDGYVLFDKLNSWKYQRVDESRRVSRDQWGGLSQFTSDALAHPIEYAIASEKDLDRYVPPDPDEEWRYDRLKTALARFKGQRAIIAHVTDVFDIAKDSMLGDVVCFTGMYENPTLIDRVQEIILEYNIRYLRNCIGLGADAVAITGDFAMTTGPFVSPEMTARFLTPPLRRQVEAVARAGLPVFKHTDGNLWKIMDLLVETGIDGLHPIDPLAGMDIAEVKAKYGRRLCILGNIDCGPTLCWKTPQDVRSEVRLCIAKAAQGGGFICTSSNSIHSGVKPDNYLAMVQAIRDYGRYPLESGGPAAAR